MGEQSNAPENKSEPVVDQEIENLKATIAQMEQRVGGIKQQAAFHLLERDLHDEAYKQFRQQLEQVAQQLDQTRFQLRQREQG